ncbi:ribonuclease H-like domain-containing protein [Tanacetum coccineum]
MSERARRASPKRNMVPRTVLTRSGPISLNIARLVNIIQPRTSVNNAGPMKNVINNAYSTARREQGLILLGQKKFLVLSAVKGNKRNNVKASACWVWRPKHKVLDHGNPQQDLKDKRVIDNGCSRHMTGNRSYLTDYKEIDGGFVAFGDFKLTDESHVLLKVPRKDNMYSVDLKNVVPQGGLTCLFAKATPDESNLWHRRLGHVNFKTMNKLVRGNLVRGLPSKLFEINQTCVACQKGKQHRASCRKLTLSFMRPFGCPVTILNTIDHLGKFDGKADEGFFVGYSTNSKAFRVFNIRTRIVEENLHLVVAGNQSIGNACTKACDDIGKARVETIPGKDYILLPLWPQDPQFSFSSKDSPNARFKPSGEEEKKNVGDSKNKDSEVPSIKEPRVNQEKDVNINRTNNINNVSPTVNVAGIKDNVVDENIVYGCVDDPNIPNLEEIVYSDDDEDNDAEADMNNLNTFMPVNPIPTTRLHKDHPLE